VVKSPSHAVGFDPRGGEGIGYFLGDGRGAFAGVGLFVIAGRKAVKTVYDSRISMVLALFRN
jgi:hypothetical protein